MGYQDCCRCRHSVISRIGFFVFYIESPISQNHHFMLRKNRALDILGSLNRVVLVATYSIFHAIFSIHGANVIEQMPLCEKKEVSLLKFPEKEKEKMYSKSLN